MSAINLAFRETRTVESRFSADRNEGIQRRIQPVDARQAFMGQFNRRDRAVAQLSAYIADCREHVILGL
jgi:hypothetical protein